MYRFAADENFNNIVLRGLLHQSVPVDVVRIQDSPVASASDAEVLQWAADEDRIVLTHDAKTMIASAEDRISRAEPMPGLILVQNAESFSEVIEQLTIIVRCSQPDKWRDQVTFLPWRSVTKQ